MASHPLANRPPAHRLAALFCISLLLASCGRDGLPFPYTPNRPDDYNLYTTYADQFAGPVAIFTHRTLNEYSDGYTSQTVACFDTAGRCIDYYYRDRSVNTWRHFSYDSLGRRILEQCWQDTSTAVLDSLRPCHTLTAYSYSRSGRRCQARITGPDHRSHTFRLRYDRAGHLTRYIYPDGSRFSYRYDTAGRLVRRTWPDASFESFQYNSAGDMTSYTDRNGVANWYMALPPPSRVDSLGRVLEQVVGHTGGPDGNPVRAFYEYDDHGNWTRRTTASPSAPTQLDIRTFTYHP